jgi:hypothetical protein
MGLAVRPRSGPWDVIEHTRKKHRAAQSQYPNHRRLRDEWGLATMLYSTSFLYS